MKQEFQELIDTIGQLQVQLDSIYHKLDIAKNQTRIKELEEQSSHPDFWQNQEKAQKALQELADLKKETETVHDLNLKLKDLAELAKIVGNEAESQEIAIELREVKSKLKELEQQTYFGGPYDRSDVILSVHAGQGGTEACDWAQMLTRMYLRYSERKKWRTKVVDEHPGEEAGLKSWTAIISGHNAYGHLKHEHGTHRLVRLSPFNADNLRQTSFALVQVLPVLPESVQINIRPEELEVDFSRSSGHGGQNVNKVSTAVRLKHRPTGTIVECQTERFQEKNRQIAMQILAAKLWAMEEEKRQSHLKALRGGKTKASWGTQIRSYVLHPYKMVKDLRTGLEDHDPVKILDGEIDQFILESLKSDQSGL